MKIEKFEELRAQFLQAMAKKKEAMEAMEAGDSMRMKAEQDHGDAMKEIVRIKNATIAHMMEESA